MKTRSFHCMVAGSCAALLWAAWACRSTGSAAPGAAWWKGNTHTHTLWSDADGAPELVTGFYRERGYAFLVLSDHNTLLRGEKWFPIRDTAGSRLTSAHVDELVDKFGAQSVQRRGAATKLEMRLTTLAELRARFEAPGVFALLEGEELTTTSGTSPVHINAVNLDEVIRPLSEPSVRATIAANLAQVKAQAASSGRAILAHVNHPNFSGA